MGTLWTPDGEGRAGRPSPGPEAPAGGPPSPPPGDGQPDEQELAARLEELRQQLAGTPAEVGVANHPFGLFELAAPHPSLPPPQLDEARNALHALAALV